MPSNHGHGGHGFPWGAWQSGADAREHGLSPDDNPYQAGTSQADAWSAGYGPIGLGSVAQWDEVPS